MSKEELVSAIQTVRKTIEPLSSHPAIGNWGIVKEHVKAVGNLVSEIESVYNKIDMADETGLDSDIKPGIPPEAKPDESKQATPENIRDLKEQKARLEKALNRQKQHLRGSPMSPKIQAQADRMGEETLAGYNQVVAELEGSSAKSNTEVISTNPLEKGVAGTQPEVNNQPLSVEDETKLAQELFRKKAEGQTILEPPANPEDTAVGQKSGGQDEVARQNEIFRKLAADEPLKDLLSSTQKGEAVGDITQPTSAIPEETVPIQATQPIIKEGRIQKTKRIAQKLGGSAVRTGLRWGRKGISNSSGFGRKVYQKWQERRRARKP